MSEENLIQKTAEELKNNLIDKQGVAMFCVYSKEVITDNVRRHQIGIIPYDINGELFQGYGKQVKEVVDKFFESKGITDNTISKEFVETID